jgi:pyruvate formate lyase activating enzyme
MQPLIFDIARGSFDDGPGIRSTVFFKGCPLRCVWCHNPESQSPLPEIAWFEKRCISCGTCYKVCPQNAHPENDPGPIDRTRCIACGKCTIECNSGALRCFGKYWSVEQLTELLLRDLIYYRKSGGGVTLSGGEPLLFSEYCSELCARLKIHDIHIAIQTSGHFDFGEIASGVLQMIDTIYYDLKLMDKEQHRLYTGRSNELIIDNLRRLESAKKPELYVRTPLVPAITATAENLAAIREFLGPLSIKGWRLLDYNPTYLSKSKALGR